MATVIGFCFLHKVNNQSGPADGHCNWIPLPTQSQQTIRTSRWSPYPGSASYTKSTINQGQQMATVTGLRFLHKVNNQSGPADGHRNQVPLPTQSQQSIRASGWSQYPGSTSYTTVISANGCHHSPHLGSASKSIIRSWFSQIRVSVITLVFPSVADPEQDSSMLLHNVKQHNVNVT
jgi:hypothetical protein